MTVTAKNTRVQYTGNGLVATYAYDWKILDQADLVAVTTDLLGADTTLVLGVGYTVTGAGNDSGGNVVLTNNLATGHLLTVYMDMDIDQPTDLTNQQSPFLERIESALDRQALVSQQLAEKLGRCIQLKPTSTDSSDELQELLESVDTNATVAAASAATATTQAGLANTARIAAESSAAFLSGLEAYQASTYGASTSSTDNATSIQAGIDALAALGGGFLDFGSGTYTTGPLTLKTGVILRGQGINATELKLKAGSNADFITSASFATLTGQNKWLVSGGVPHGFGFMDMRLNGNKANQSSGDGIKFYGKRIIVERALVFDCYGVGYYSECGDTGGQATWQDIPEGRIAYLNVQSCGSHGFQYRGPHDGNIESLFVSACGGDGVRLEYSAGVYNGGCDIGFIHEYACTGYGFYSDPMQYRVRHLISESNYKEGLYFQGTGCQFGMVQLYNNCRSTGSFQAVFTAAAVNSTFGSIQMQHNWPGAMAATIGGLDVLGYGIDIAALAINGNASTGTGLRLSYLADRNCITGNIYGFNGAGGVGLETGYGGFINDTELNLSIINNASQWKNTTAGARNIYAMALRCINGSGQVLMAAGSVPPNTANDIEVWDVVGIDQAGVFKKSSFATSSTTGISLGVVGATTGTYAHNLLFTPELDHVSVSAMYKGANATWVLGQPFHINSIDATNIGVRNRVSTASGTAKNITGATKANPCVLTVVGHGFSNGDLVCIAGVGGMTQLNGNIYTVGNKADDTFELSGINSTAYGTYTGGGTACPDYMQIAVQARL